MSVMVHCESPNPTPAHHIFYAPKVIRPEKESFSNKSDFISSNCAKKIFLSPWLLANEASSSTTSSTVKSPVQPPSQDTVFKFSHPKKRRLLENISLPKNPAVSPETSNGFNIDPPKIEISSASPQNFASPPAKRPKTLPLLKDNAYDHTTTLISPDIPRPKRSFAQQYINGQAYTTLGFKCHTRSSYCSLFKTQPMYVPQETDPRLSMYSNWKPAPPAQTELEGCTPRQMMGLYQSLKPVYSPRTIYTQAATTTSVHSTHSSYWVYSKKHNISNEKLPESSVAKEPSPQPISVLQELQESEELVEKYICEICGLKCKKSNRLKKHLLSHNDTRPYLCKTCNFSFRSKDNLSKHLKSKSHFKKCLELGMNASSIQSDHIDYSALAKQEKLEKMCHLLNFQLPDEISDEEQLPDSEESEGEELGTKEKLAAHTLLDLSGQGVVKEDTTLRIKNITIPLSVQQAAERWQASEGLDLRVTQQPTGSKDRTEAKSSPFMTALAIASTIQNKAEAIVQDQPIDLRVRPITPTSNSSAALHFFPQDPDMASDGAVKCNLCDKTFSKNSQFRIHLNVHYLEKHYRCEDCSLSFKTMALLDKHKRSATHFNKVSVQQNFGVPTDDNPRPFKCIECDIAFRIHGHLAKHLRSKVHIMKLECIGKLPIGMFADLERNGCSLNEMDTTDCENSLESLQKMAKKMYPDIVDTS